MRDIEKILNRLQEKGEGALIAYVTGGDPHPRHTQRIVEALIRGGADIVELGIPFSDPIADGSTIQNAALRALEVGTVPKKVIETARIVRKEHKTPIIILTYYNIIFRMGLETFFTLAEKSGVNGVIVPDLPIEEAGDYEIAAENHEVDTIFLAAPSTPRDRLLEIIEHTSGFLYLVSVFGVTGARETLQKLTLQTIRRTLPHTKGKIPLCVGFGISETEHVRSVIKNGADGAIVGSAFVKIIQENKREINTITDKMEAKARELKTGTRSFG